MLKKLIPVCVFMLNTVVDVDNPGCGAGGRGVGVSHIKKRGCLSENLNLTPVGDQSGRVARTFFFFTPNRGKSGNERFFVCLTIESL